MADKYCPGCTELKDQSEFSRSSYHADGRQPYCKPCASEKEAISHGRRRGAWKTAKGPDFIEEPERDWYDKPDGPPHGEDSKRYACMAWGWSYKGIPPGHTRQTAFCSVCLADGCIRENLRGTDG